MIRAVFFCNIYREDDIMVEGFDFDEGTFESQEELDKYIKSCNYEIGEPCGYWGNDVGFLTEIITDEV